MSAIVTADRREEPFFLPVGSGRLYGIRYRPGPGSHAGAPWCVFLDPLDNEAEWSIRFHVRLARRLAATGRPVLRFDYRGTGNSSGEFSQVSLETLLDDVEALVGEARSLAGGSGSMLLGARFGAVVALLFATRRAPAEDLLLLDPVLDVRRYFKTVFVDREILGRKLAGQAGGRLRRSIDRSLESAGYAELVGLPFGRAFHGELGEFRIDDVLRPRFRRGLVAVPQARRSPVERRALEALADRGLDVRHLPAHRGMAGWGTENFSAESQLTPALEAAVLDHLAPAPGRGG